MVKSPKLLKILLNDYTAFVATVFIIIFGVGFFIYLALETVQITDNFFIITLAVTFISLLILSWRVRLFYIIFADGLETPATISYVSFFRDRGRVDYIFSYHGQKFTAGNIVRRGRLAKSYKVGDEVVVMIDRNNPNRAYIRDLYL